MLFCERSFKGILESILYYIPSVGFLSLLPFLVLPSKYYSITTHTFIYKKYMHTWQARISMWEKVHIFFFLNLGDLTQYYTSYIQLFLANFMISFFSLNKVILFYICTRYSLPIPLPLDKFGHISFVYWIEALN